MEVTIVSQAELIQALQFIIILFVTFFFVYNVVHNFKFSWTLIVRISDYFCISTVILYLRNLYVVNYECFHKYEIWRLYRFS